MKIGRSQLRDVCRSARLPEKVVSESLTVLIQNGLLRWVTVEDGPIDGTFYECFFEDVYPLIRYGKEISLTERHIGPEVPSPIPPTPSNRSNRFLGWKSGPVHQYAGAPKD